MCVCVCMCARVCVCMCMCVYYCDPLCVCVHRVKCHVSRTPERPGLLGTTRLDEFNPAAALKETVNVLA